MCPVSLMEHHIIKNNWQYSHYLYKHLTRSVKILNDDWAFH